MLIIYASFWDFGTFRFADYTITSVRIHDKLYFGNSDTIMLQSNQRDLSIGFAMLDYSNTETKLYEPIN